MSEELKQPSKCRECGGKSLTWAADKQNNSGVQNGRLSMHDVRGIFVLGCNDCSATLAVVSADNIAAHLNTRAELSAIKGVGEAVAWIDDAGTIYPTPASVGKYMPPGRSVTPLYTRPPVAAEPVEVVAYLCNGGTRTLMASDKKEAVWNAGHPLMEVAQHQRIVAALAAPPAAGAVPVPKTWQERLELMHPTVEAGKWPKRWVDEAKDDELRELRALLARGVES